MRLIVPFGAMTELAKLASVVPVLESRRHDVRVVDTGEHGERSLASVCCERFCIERDAVWEPPAAEAERLAWVLEQALREVRSAAPDCVIVLGDGCDAALFSVAARWEGVPVVRFAAGLPPFDDRTGFNRRIAADAASVHLVSSPDVAEQLRREGTDPERIRVVGDPTADALRLVGVRRRAPAIRAGVLMSLRDPGEGEFDVVEMALAAAEVFGPLSLLVDDAARSQLLAAGAWSKLEGSAVRLLPSLPFAAAVELVATARVVITDSSYLLDEAVCLRVPVVALPRVEGDFVADVERAIRRGEDPDGGAHRTPAGDAGARIAEVLSEPATQELLARPPCPPELLGMPSHRESVVVT